MKPRTAINLHNLPKSPTTGVPLPPFEMGRAPHAFHENAEEMKKHRFSNKLGPMPQGRRKF